MYIIIERKNCAQAVFRANQYPDDERLSYVHNLEGENPTIVGRAYGWQGWPNRGRGLFCLFCLSYRPCRHDRSPSSR